MSTTIAELLVTSIRLDGGAQTRCAIDEAYVAELAELLADPAFAFDPIDVCKDADGALWPWDGFHRLKAQEQACRRTIYARVQPGTARDAVLLACGANAKHGLRRTYADKERAVLVLLHDPEWQKWNDAELGRRCAVNRSTVKKVRDNHNLRGPDVRLQVGRYGNVQEIDVSTLTRRAFDALPEAERIKAMQRAEADGKERAERYAAEKEATDAARRERKKRVVQVLLMVEPPLYDRLHTAASKAGMSIPKMLLADLEAKYGG